MSAKRELVLQYGREGLFFGIDFVKLRRALYVLFFTNSKHFLSKFQATLNSNRSSYSKSITHTSSLPGSLKMYLRIDKTAKLKFILEKRTLQDLKMCLTIQQQSKFKHRSLNDSYFFISSSQQSNSEIVNYFGDIGDHFVALRSIVCFVKLVSSWNLIIK